MSVNAILAVDNGMGIGFNGGLPWPHNPKDMKWFKDNTTGHVVVMGYTTWASFGYKRLPNRVNVVVTRRDDVKGEPDVVVCGNIKDVLEQLEEKYPHLHIWVIGGANLYRQALPYCDKLYITHMKKYYQCDTFMYGSELEGFTQTDYIDDDEDMTIQIRSRG